MTGRVSATELAYLGLALAPMTINSHTVDVTNDEAVSLNGEAIGYISSGSYAHYVGESMALGYVPTEFSVHGQTVEVEINGAMYTGTTTGMPLYDANGGRVRS